MNEKTQPCTHCGAVHPRVNLTWMGSAELCPECLQRYFRALLAGDFALLPANRKPDQPLGCAVRLQRLRRRDFKGGKARS